MENSLRRTLSISNGDFCILFHSPIAIGLYLVTAAMLVLAFFMAFRDRRRARATS
jgi:putative tricarboxylic transport membrane protein